MPPSTTWPTSWMVGIAKRENTIRPVRTLDSSLSASSSVRRRYFIGFPAGSSIVGDIANMWPANRRGQAFRVTAGGKTSGYRGLQEGRGTMFDDRGEAGG